MKDIVKYNRVICIYAIVAVVIHFVGIGWNAFWFVLPTSTRTTIAGF
jgi:hypothetical protein